MASLAERYRPQRWADVVGQDKALAKVATVRNRCGSLGGRAWFISGKSGQGKTTIARLIAGEIAAPLAVEEWNGADVGLEEVRQMEREMGQGALAGEGQPTGRAWIINEAHLLRGATLTRLLTALEPDGGIPRNAVVVFTTTKVGAAKLFDDYDDAGPLVSRCTELRLTDQGFTPAIAEFARRVATAEGIDGLAPEAYLKLAKRCEGNGRRVLAEIEAGALTD